MAWKISESSTTNSMPISSGSASSNRVAPGGYSDAWCESAISKNTGGRESNVDICAASYQSDRVRARTHTRARVAAAAAYLLVHELFELIGGAVQQERVLLGLASERKHLLLRTLE